MSRYIDVDKIEFPVFESKADETWVNVAINATPTADVRENKRGEWLERCEIDGGFGATCNVCGEYCALQYTDDRKFCSNCGADMRTKDEV